MTTAMHSSQSAPLPDDWSPADIWAAIGDNARHARQLGIDALKARLAGQAYCEHSCEEHDDLRESYLLREHDVFNAINGEKTLSGAARKRIYAALGIETD